MNTIKMEVFPGQVKSGTSRAGNDYIMQTVYLDLPGSPVPEKISIFVDEIIQPGKYDLDLMASLYVQNERLQVGTLVYKPEEAPKAKAVG